MARSISAPVASPPACKHAMPAVRGFQAEHDLAGLPAAIELGADRQQPVDCLRRPIHQRADCRGIAEPGAGDQCVLFMELG